MTRKRGLAGLAVVCAVAASCGGGSSSSTTSTSTGGEAGASGSVSASGGSEAGGNGGGPGSGGATAGPSRVGDFAPLEGNVIVELMGREGCLSSELTTDDDGRITCGVLQADPENDDCSDNSLRAPSDDARQAVNTQLETVGFCGGTTGYSCDNYALCQLRQLNGTARDECLTGTAEASTLSESGFCYIDPSLQNSSGDYIAGGSVDESNPHLSECGAADYRTIRFVGSAAPDPIADSRLTFLACVQ